MKKLIALIAVIGFITVKSVSAQTAEKGNALKPATEKQADNAELRAYFQAPQCEWYLQFLTGKHP